MEFCHFKTNGSDMLIEGHIQRPDSSSIFKVTQAISLINDTYFEKIHMNPETAHAKLILAVINSDHCLVQIFTIWLM
jgi:hypothetical protein